MRALIILLVVVFLLLGALFGALNPEPVGYDFLFWHATVAKGPALLVALVIGWLLGGALAWAGVGVARQHGLRTRKRDPGGDSA